MSGGAVINDDGHVVGIISRGWDTEDQQGPSLAAWWLPAIMWRPELSWPNGFYEEGTPLFELPAVNIVGRDTFKSRRTGMSTSNVRRNSSRREVAGCSLHADTAYSVKNFKPRHRIL